MRIDIKKNHQLNNEFPQSLIDYYTRKVNENYLNLQDAKHFKIEYEYDKDAKLIKNVSPFEFPIKFKIPKDIKNEIQNYEDFEKYIYNSQTTIELDNEENPYVMIEDTKVPVKNMILDEQGRPSQDYKIGLAAIPFSSDDKLSIKIDVYGTSKTLYLERKPYKSVNTRLYENEELKELFIFSLKLDLNKINLSITPTISKPISVRNIVFVNELVKAFKEKELKINDVPMSNLFRDETSKEDEKDNELIEKINMWKNIYSLEKRLGLDFTVKLPLNSSESSKVEELLVSLILNKPFIDNTKINSININCKSVEELEKIEKEMLKAKKNSSSIMVGGQLSETINLFQEEFILYERYQAINVIVTDVFTDSQTLELELHITNSKKDNSYVVKKYSDTSIEYEEIADDLKNAKKLEVYVDEFLSSVIE